MGAASSRPWAKRSRSGAASEVDAAFDGDSDGGSGETLFDLDDEAADGDEVELLPRGEREADPEYLPADGCPRWTVALPAALLAALAAAAAALVAVRISRLPPPTQYPIIPDFKCTSTVPPRRKYVLFASHEEQLSNSRLHFAEWVYAAKITNRTLVLPRVGVSRIMLEGQFRFGAYFDPAALAEYLPGGVVDLDDWVAELAERSFWEANCAPDTGASLPLNGTSLLGRADGNASEPASSMNGTSNSTGAGAPPHRLPTPYTVTAMLEEHARLCPPDPDAGGPPHPLHQGTMYLRYHNGTIPKGRSALDFEGENAPRRTVRLLKEHPLAAHYLLDTSPSDAAPRVRCIVARDNVLGPGAPQDGSPLAILRQISPTDMDADVWLATKTHAAGDWQIPSWDRMAEAEDALRYPRHLEELAARAKGALGARYLAAHWRMEEARMQRFDWEGRGGKEDEPEACGASLAWFLNRTAAEANVTGGWKAYVSTDHTDPATLDMLGLAKSSSQPPPESLPQYDRQRLEHARTEAQRRDRAYAALRASLGDRMRTFADVLPASAVTGPVPASLLASYNASFHLAPPPDPPEGQGGMARDPGLLGIFDKLVLRGAAAFLWGAPPCGRHFTHYAWEVEEWRKGANVTGADGVWNLTEAVRVVAFNATRMGRRDGGTGGLLTEIGWDMG